MHTLALINLRIHILKHTYNLNVEYIMREPYAWDHNWNKKPQNVKKRIPQSCYNEHVVRNKLFRIRAMLNRYQQHRSMSLIWFPFKKYLLSSYVTIYNNKTRYCNIFRMSCKSCGRNVNKSLLIPKRVIILNHNWFCFNNFRIMRGQTYVWYTFEW